MGETEDTFTKQEIQAGYVTSGRDVLARQQQIVAQALAAGQMVGSRRRVGGGGPSGTGKSSAAPVFPVPTFDEPPKPSSTGLVPAPAQIGRSSTVTASMTTPSIPHPVAVPRAVSLGGRGMSPPPLDVPSVAVSVLKPTGAQIVSGMAAAPARRSTLAMPASAPVSAASVVAGMHSFGNTPAEPPAPHTTLTPLTPLKRTTAKGAKAPGAPTLTSLGDPSTLKLSSLRTKPLSNANGLVIGSGSISPTAPKLSMDNITNDFSIGSLGGAAIGGANGPIGGGTIGGRSTGLGALQTNDSDNFHNNLIGGSNLGGGLDRQNLTTNIGGDIFTGGLLCSKPIASVSSNDKWIGAPISDNNNGFGISGGDIWGGGSSLSGSGTLGGFPSGPVASSDVIGGGVIGGAPIGGSFGGTIGGQNNGSSALASMLGINLPTGSGSLRESSSLFDNVGPPSAPYGYNNGFSGGFAPGVIGGGPKLNLATPGPIGGSAIGGGGRIHSGVSVPFNNMQPSSIGGGVGNNNDIALLQTLLPGVHITSGGGQQPVAPGGFGSVGPAGNWGSNSMPSQTAVGGNVVGSNQGGFGYSWGGGGSVVQSRPAVPGGGIIGQSGNQKQNQNIW